MPGSALRTTPIDNWIIMRLPKPRTIRFLARLWPLLLLGLVATAWCVRPVADIDVQWHLKAGAWMLDHGRVITEDFYSVSKWGREWTSVPWLYQVVLAWLFRHAGWWGPTIWQWLIALGVTFQTAVLVWLFRRRGTRWDWRWPVLSVPAILAVIETLRMLEVRFQHRPEMTTHLLLGTYVLLLECRRRGTFRWARRAIWLLLPLQVWWANTHGVFILGPLVIGAYVAAAWTGVALAGARSTPVDSSRSPAAIRPALALTALLAASLLVCFISPYGHRSALYPVHLFRVLTAPVFKYGISEALPVTRGFLWHGGPGNRLLVAGWGLMAVGLLARIRTTKHAAHCSLRTASLPTAHCPLLPLPLGYIFTCLGMAYISITAIRNIPLLGLVGAPLMASGLETVADGIRGLVLRFLPWLPARTARRERAMRLAPRVAAALLLILLYRAIVSERYYEATGRPTRFAIGHSDHEFPIAGVDFLEKHLPRMAPLATFGDTRSEDIFLNRLGPTWKTYIDGRHAEVYDAPFFAAYGETLGRQGVFFQEAGKYGIGYAIFSLQDMQTGRDGLAMELNRHPGWALLYLDDCAAVFAATVPTNMPMIARFALPPAPEAWSEQRPAFGAWLQRHGWRRLDELYRPANGALNADFAARALPAAMQLGGLWPPRRNLEAWRLGRLASFLSSLGWRVVADDLYDLALANVPLHRRVADYAINHAIECFDTCADPQLKPPFLARARARSEALRREDSGAPAALYGLAFADANEGALLPAMTRLETLLKRRRDVVILDHLARVYGELGDQATTPDERRRLWREAVRAWRKRLTRHPAGPGTYRAYLRLGDLFTRLEEPLLARANYMNALNEPDIAPAMADAARSKVIAIEIALFGGSYVPGAAAVADTPNPYQFPVPAPQSASAPVAGGTAGMRSPGDPPRGQPQSVQMEGERPGELPTHRMPAGPGTTD